MPPRQLARRRAPRKRQRPGQDAATTATDQSPRPAPSAVAAGVAAIVLGVPLTVLGRAAGPYDDPKAWALPILVGLTGLAWLVRARVDPAPAPAATDRHARILRWIVLLCMSWWAITTAISVAPFQSALGSFGRGMGLLEIASAALLFFLVRPELRSARGARSLVDLALLGSVPVCLIAFGQAAGWDPLPQPWDPAIAPMTVRSTLGSHIFLGSYLIVLIPLAAARLEWACRERVETGRWSRGDGAQWLHALAASAWAVGAVVLIGLTAHWPFLWWALVPWGIVGAGAWALLGQRAAATADTALAALSIAGLLVAQVAVVILSRGRGAFIGMLVGLSATGLAFLIRRRAWRTLAAAGLGLALLVAFLVLLNLPGSPVAPLRKQPLLSRLSDIGNVRRGSPGWVRLQVWKGIADGWRRQLLGEEMVPGLSPRIRSLVGYGPETQLLVLEPLTTPFLGVLPARGEGWQARYVFDRSHNVLLDHLVTEGMIGAGLWILLVASLVAVGISRIRASVGAGEMTIRLGALGALLGHLADGQVGIETPIVLALFWIFASLLTSGPWSAPASAPPARSLAPMTSRPLWITVLTLTTLVTALVAWTGTRWLLASVAYAAGTRHGIAGRLSDADREFRRSITLMPWLSLAAEAAAYTALRLAGSEADLSRRVALLRDGQAILARARQHAMGGADSWALTGQLAFAEARAEGRTDFAVSRTAFAWALRLRPGDARLLAQSGWIWLESRDAPRAQETARQALARDRREWLGWALLARSARELGNPAESERAAGMARALAPSEARRLLDTLLP